jgi:hypothetical protein
MQKSLDEMQNILHLRRPNTKDFNRGSQNPKDFAFTTHTSKIFSILCACADSCVLTYVRTPTQPPFGHNCLSSCKPQMQNLLHSRSCVPARLLCAMVCAPDSRLPQLLTEMQRILCERVVLSDRRFLVACAPKDSAGRARSG